MGDEDGRTAPENPDEVVSEAAAWHTFITGVLTRLQQGAGGLLMSYQFYNSSPMSSDRRLDQANTVESVLPENPSWK